MQTIGVKAVEERLRELMIRSLAGDEKAYRILLQECGQRLRAFYLRRLDELAAADDLVQETLIAIHTRRATYDATRPFTAWLYAIARYKFIDYLRSHRRQRAIALDDTPQDLLAVDESDTAAVSQDLDQLLQSVPPLTRGLIQAVKIEGRSIAEVSAASGLSESAVKVAVHRALKRLSKRFGGEGAP